MPHGNHSSHEGTQEDTGTSLCGIKYNQSVYIIVWLRWKYVHLAFFLTIIFAWPGNVVFTSRVAKISVASVY